ncbi:MAG: class I SAM-dependent methyltransferase [Proteobacteria bacterium]|nr:class I SAM-dependent methyltransferase [Pseudomonadota bacterium]
MSIKAVFDLYASQYDGSRRKLIPCFADFYRTAREIIPFAPEERLTILDLGAGTGLLTSMVAADFANARFSLMDISANMLAEAEKRLSGYGNEFSYVVADYSRIPSLGEQFDLIMSSLSIHHLDQRQKQELFGKVFAHLAPGGVFVNADQALGETAEIEKIYRQKWLEQVKGNGVTDAELQGALTRMKEDRMSTLSWQLASLQDAGFHDVNCWYQHYSFAVYSGSR